MKEDKLCSGCMEEKTKDTKCPHCGWVEGSAPESALHLPPGTVLQEKYLIGRALGQGGFGITYLAWDMNLNLKLAVKEYLPQELAYRTGGQSEVSIYKKSLADNFNYGLEKFIEEARTLARFNEHPNIVTVRDYFEANNTAYLVMNYIEGVTLKEYLESRDKPLTFEQAIDIFMPVLDALKEVHTAGILHRDISPDNLLIDKNGRVVLIDFGAARQAMGKKSKSLSVIMKAGYSPPEQYQSKGKQGPWTDIYAVAATFYRAITGHAPLEAIDRMAEDNLKHPSEMGVKLDPKQEQILLDALAVKAGERFQTVKEYHEALIFMESFKICKNDHYYEKEKYRICPWCVMLGEEDFEKTVPNGAPHFGGNNKELDQRLVEANNGLGINIFLKLAEAGKGQNFFISPASIIISLAIAYNGSAGDTRLAMKKTMQLEGMLMEDVNAAFASLLNILQDPDLGVELILANSLWAREGVGFNEDFLKRNQDYFGAKIAELNFSSADAASIINQWVSSKTQNRIKGIVEPPISGDLILYLINAIYFKGQWTEPFENRLTKENSFYLPGGSVKKHPTMFREGGFRYLENKLFQAVSLPYGKNARLSMYVFLPVTDIGLEGFYNELSGANWKRWIGSFGSTKVELGLPRFQFEYASSLKNVLSTLGMELAFDENRADFSGMGPLPPAFYFSDIKHKTFVEVNEKGTEAAAVFSTGVLSAGMRMIVDRPFFFSIVDNVTGTILFMGTVLEPKT